MIQKLIDAYELEREMYRKCINTDEEIEKGRAKWDSGLWIRYKVFEDAITLAPRVDAEPIRHGKWIMSDIEEEEEKSNTDFARLYECSVCGAGYVYRMPEDIAEEKYCYNCGAKMEGAEE